MMKKRILLVEDDAILRRSLEWFLQQREYEVTVCDNGTDAIRTCSEQVFDLVVTDLNMPFTSGLELINAIRNEQQSDVPVIVLTSMGQEATELEAFRLGASEFISKPFSPAVLEARIGKLLR
jgi:DNA-binding response OmpR family regulator